MPSIVSATAVIPRIAPDNVLIFDLDNTLKHNFVFDWVTNY